MLQNMQNKLQNIAAAVENMTPITLTRGASQGPTHIAYVYNVLRQCLPVEGELP